MKQTKRRQALLLAVLLIMAGTVGVYAAGMPDGEGTEADTLGIVTIDNQNCYEGMDKTYAEGYVPRIENGRALVVIPLVCDRELKEDTLQTSLNLGDTQSAPFVYKNYNKNIVEHANSVNNGSGHRNSYLAEFSLELKTERFNGSYPVILSARGTDITGHILEQEFTVYVTITDGKDPNVQEKPDAEETAPVFAPKVLVQSYRFVKKESGSDVSDTAHGISAGDTVTAEITLVNTSSSSGVLNMTAAVAAPGEFLTLLSPSDSVYVGSLGAGEMCGISFDYQIGIDAPEGQYDLELTLDYADAKGNVYSGSGRAKLSVRQPASVQFDPVVIQPKLEVGDVTEVQIQAMNMGRSKVYNVRAVLDADGLTPQGTIFIGDMEPGTVMTGSTQITAGGLSGNSTYGVTEGTITFCYEDEAGNELTETQTFTTEITSPFTQNPEEEKDEPGQWWIIMAVIAGLLCILTGILAVRRWKGTRRDEQVEEVSAAKETE